MDDRDEEVEIVVGAVVVRTQGQSQHWGEQADTTAAVEARLDVRQALERLPDRLADPDQRKRIGEETLRSLEWEWQDIYISAVASQANRDAVGKNIAQLASEAGKEPIDVVLDLLAAERGARNQPRDGNQVHGLPALGRKPAAALAMPALGTGVGHVPPPASADAMLNAVVAHLKAGGSTLRKVVFVLYQDDAYRAFTETLKRLGGAQ